ncbi:hypothetical protein [Stakelama marina]|uniref:Lipoprotein n=1 Tax=Stakelama marina TaxID=2826939 RepID=A0A8T4IHN6_9SPHN|nr:hypothetical protein [Stakelama marina]MBR0551726.1 hypothetical protein [Stakelama marina]
MKSPAFASAALALGLAACSSGSPNNPTANTLSVPSNVGSTIPSAPQQDADARRSSLMAAAEPFEALTEQAETASPQKLVELIAKAKASANGASSLLPADASKQLSQRVSNMETAQSNGQPVDVALQSVEAYRLLVSNAGNTGPVPTAVSLLDYSGFRYQADLKAQPARWNDAGKAAAFAQNQWDTLGSQVQDAKLRDQMANKISDMRKAVANRDMKLAMSASTKELDLVDALEKYFNGK